MLTIADILSDLTSLRVGDPNAALNLVSARAPDTPAAISNQQLARASTSHDSTDVDLARARDLLDLHASVKLAHRNGLDQSLLQARQHIRLALDNI